MDRKLRRNPSLKQVKDLHLKCYECKSRRATAFIMGEPVCSDCFYLLKYFLLKRWREWKNKGGFFNFPIKKIKE